jgi:hypothetical protein
MVLTLEADQANADHLLSTLATLVNDPLLELVEVSKGSLVMKVVIAEAAAAIAGALEKSKLLGKMLGAPVKKIDGAPRISSSFRFNQLLDSIELLGHADSSIAESAARRANNLKIWLPEWTPSINAAVRTYYAGLSNSLVVLSQNELDEAAADVQPHRRRLAPEESHTCPLVKEASGYLGGLRATDVPHKLQFGNRLRRDHLTRARRQS